MLYFVENKMKKIKWGICYLQIVEGFDREADREEIEASHS